MTAKNVTIHPTAIVHESAQLGEGVQVHPFAMIDADTVIGAGSVIGPRVRVCRYTHMGANNIVGDGTVLGNVPQDRKFDPATETFLRMGDGNEFHEFVVVHRATKAGSATIIGDNNYFMNNAHVAHDCVLGNDITMAPSALLGGFVEVHDRAYMSGNTGIHQFCRMGRMSLIHGCCAISQDLPPFCIASRVNRLVGLNIIGMRRAGVEQEARKRVREAYHTIFRQQLPLQEALAIVDAAEASAASGPCDEVQELLTFIRESKRGVVTYKPHVPESEM